MKSYLKFLSRNKLYTVIEAVGLAVSLAFVILIGSYVVQQYEVAHESSQWKRTFVLGSDDFLGLTYWDKEELEMNIPEVEAATHAAMLWQPVIQKGEEPVQASGIEADADFFKVFPEYHLLEGSLEDFVGKEDVLISVSLARKINAKIGQTIKVDKADRTIKGIYADFDGAFFMPADVITNISNSWALEQGKVFNSIGNYTTWFRVREDADLDEVQAKVKALLHKNYDASWAVEKVDSWKAYRMDEAFFFTGSSNGLTRTGNVQMLRLLTVVVLLLLLSAIFNYVNLSLALTGKRAKEMATRRLLGADRTGILWKYIGESVAFTAVCFAAALLLADLLAPMVNSLVGEQPGLQQRPGRTDAGGRHQCAAFLHDDAWVCPGVFGRYSGPGRHQRPAPGFRRLALRTYRRDQGHAPAPEQDDSEQSFHRGPERPFGLPDRDGPGDGGADAAHVDKADARRHGQSLLHRVFRPEL